MSMMCCCPDDVLCETPWPVWAGSSWCDTPWSTWFQMADTEYFDFGPDPYKPAMDNVLNARHILLQRSENTIDARYALSPTTDYIELPPEIGKWGNSIPWFWFQIELLEDPIERVKVSLLYNNDVAGPIVVPSTFTHDVWTSEFFQDCDSLQEFDGEWDELVNGILPNGVIGFTDGVTKATWNPTPALTSPPVPTNYFPSISSLNWTATSENGLHTETYDGLGHVEIAVGEDIPDGSEHQRFHYWCQVALDSTSWYELFMIPCRQGFTVNPEDIFKIRAYIGIHGPDKYLPPQQNGGIVGGFRWGLFQPPTTGTYEIGFEFPVGGFPIHHLWLREFEAPSP